MESERCRVSTTLQPVLIGMLNLERMESETISPNVRWGGIVAGFFVALATQLALGLFTDAAPWQLLVTIAAPFAGAFAATWIGHPTHQSSAIATGLIVWALTVVASSVLLMGLFSASVVLTDGGIPGIARGWSGFWAGFAALLGLGGALIGALLGQGRRPVRPVGRRIQRDEALKSTVRDVGPPVPPPARLHRDEPRVPPPDLH